MGNRSLPRTVWHLFSRPGYMIGDYLDGKRIAFFPPVKLLFVLCVFYAVVVSLLGYDNPSDVLSSLTAEGANSQELAKATLSISGHSFSVMSLTETAYHLLHWLDHHKAIELIGLHCFFMLFAWRVFRKAPAHPQTTLAENFFAQVFISCQMMSPSSIFLSSAGPIRSTTFIPSPRCCCLPSSHGTTNSSSATHGERPSSVPCWCICTPLSSLSWWWRPYWA